MKNSESKGYYYSYTTTTAQLSPTRVEWSFRHSEDYSYGYPAHMHPYYEIYVYIKGDVSFVVNNRISKLTRGDIVLTAPNQYHHAVCPNFEPHDHYVVNFWVNDPTIRQLLDRLAERNYLCYPEPVREEIISLLEEHIRFLKENAGNSDPFTENYTFSRLLFLLKGEVSTVYEDRGFPDALKKALAYIGKEFTNLKGTKILADLCFVDQTTLTRMFRKYLHLTPYQYIESLKMHNACTLLTKGVSVTQAAMESGFPDCSHFISRFRERFGITPLQFKTQLRENATPRTILNPPSKP